MGDKEIKFEENNYVNKIAKVKKWLVKVGDFVEAEETILIIEIGIEEIELKSTTTGELSKINPKEGDLIYVGDVIAVIEEEEEEEEEEDDENNDSELNESIQKNKLNHSNEINHISPNESSSPNPKYIFRIKNILKSKLIYLKIGIFIITAYLFKAINTNSKIEIKQEPEKVKEKTIKDSLINLEKKENPISEKIIKSDNSIEKKKQVKKKRIKNKFNVAVVPFSEVNVVPIFPGCENVSSIEKRACFHEKINEHIRENFRYPELAFKKRIQGRVYLQFTISENGIVTNILKQGPDKLLEKEAYRIISLLPKMKPGEHNGNFVKVTYSIPISFRIS